MNDVKCCFTIGVWRLLAVNSLVGFYLQHCESLTSSTTTVTKLSKLNFDYDVIIDGASQLTYQQCKTNELYRNLFILSYPSTGRNIQCSFVKPELTSHTYQPSMSTQENPISGEDVMETNENEHKRTTGAPKRSSEAEPIPNGADESEKNPKKPTKAATNERNVPKGRSRLSLSKKEAEFGTSLEDFGYKFDKEGVLRDMETNEGFLFVVGKGHNQSYYQKRYEALGAVVTEHVYELLETQCGLQRHYVPIDASETDARSFVFASEDLFSNEDCLLILIHGSGAVRAGQWARSIIINKSINEGTQIPYIEEAQSKGWAVLVLNTNLNFALKTDPNGQQSMDEVQGSATPSEHASYVWEHFVAKSKAKTIFIVAHSAGGLVTAQLAEKFVEDFTDRVRNVGLTDSVHALKYMDVNKQVEEFYEKNVINWVSAPTPLDTEVKRHLYSGRDCKQRSAGTTKHELTSHCAKNSIFKWFLETYSDINSDSNMSADDAMIVQKGDDGQSADDDNEDELMKSADESLMPGSEGAQTSPTVPPPEGEMNS